MNKKVNKIFLYILVSLFVAFAALYLSQATGYYSYEQHKKMVLTEEQIKQFEQDVKEGKNIDIKEYINNPSKDYQSKTSELGLKISLTIGSIARKGIESIFKTLGQMVE